MHLSYTSESTSALSALKEITDVHFPLVPADAGSGRVPSPCQTDERLTNLPPSAACREGKLQLAAEMGAPGVVVQVLGLAPGASRAFWAGPGEGTLRLSGLQPHKKEAKRTFSMSA